MATGGKDVDEEFIAVDGIVASGVFGVAVAPTDATTPLGVTWHDHGLTTDTGVTRTQPVSRTVRRAWQNAVKLKSPATEAAVRWSFVLVQTTEANVELFAGTAMVDGVLGVNPAEDWPQIAFCFDTIEGDNIIREYAPSARVVEVGDRVAVSADTYGWPITIESDYSDVIENHTLMFFSEFEPEGP